MKTFVTGIMIPKNKMPNNIIIISERASMSWYPDVLTTPYKCAYPSEQVEPVK